MTSDGLTVREAVERLGVGRASVDRWCRSGKLKAAQRGLRWIVGADAFEAPATERARWIPTPTQRASWVPRHPRSLLPCNGASSPPAAPSAHGRPPEP
jgi:excisionase family DNA binding protein